MASTQPELFASIPTASQWNLARATIHDRICGTLVGSALGDTIGLYTEFLSKKASEAGYPTRKFTLWPPAEATAFVRDFHRGPHETGDWTDDTDHALLILLSYLHADGQKLDPLDFARRLRTWVDMGLRALDTVPLGLGRTVGTIVRKAVYLDGPEAVARDVWVRNRRDLAPNGSLMRTHPLGLMCLAKSLEETFEVAASYSVVTHVDPRCVVACAVGTALVRGLVRGEVSEEKHIDGMVNDGFQWYQKWRSVKEEGDESWKEDPVLDRAELDRHVQAKCLADLQLDEAAKIGYVYKTFGSGILLLRLAMREMARDGADVGTPLEIFERLITDLIMEGGDADTNACFAGALLGAFLGYKALPPHWRDGLRHGKWLIGKAEALSKVLRVKEGGYSGAEDRDTYPDGGRGFLTKDQMDGQFMRLQARMVEKDKEYQRQQGGKSKKKILGLF